MWGVKEPTIVTTDKKALARFFQAKQVPPKLWKFVSRNYHLLSFLQMYPVQGILLPICKLILATILSTDYSSSSRKAYQFTFSTVSSHQIYSNKTMVTPIKNLSRRTLKRRHNPKTSLTQCWKCSISNRMWLISTLHNANNKSQPSWASNLCGRNITISLGSNSTPLYGTR